MSISMTASPALEDLDFRHRRLAWESAVPLGAVAAGIAGVFTAPLGAAMMAACMAGGFLVTAGAGRALWRG